MSERDRGDGRHFSERYRPFAVRLLDLPDDTRGGIGGAEVIGLCDRFNVRMERREEGVRVFCRCCGASRRFSEPTAREYQDEWYELRRGDEVGVGRYNGDGGEGG